MSQNKSPNILIVDDNRNNIFTLNTLINEHISAQIFEAESGIVALQILLQEDIDLIILDVQMPNLDGFATAKLIRSRKKTQHIPIVFLTAAYKSEEFKQKGFSIGAADYLTKPIDTNQLISRIKSYLRFIEQERLHNAALEQKVQKRTAELLKANQHLTQEIAERKQIENKLQETHNQLEQRVQERTAELSATNQQLQIEITERKQAEATLQEAKNSAENARATAEAANLSKSQFLANMSHELRTPLNAIIGYTEMLIEDAEDSELKDSITDLQRVLSAGKHLLGLINDVLDLSKIEAGKMELCLETFDINTFFEEIISTIRPLMEKRNNTISVKCSSNLGNMCADMVKLRQILLNLLSNAAKFTEKGLVNIEVSRETQDDHDWIRFTITDDGIGMTQEQRQKLFQPFVQADSSTTRKYGGTGLGLTISKKFTEMMGGTIMLVSEFGNGSMFTVLLPISVSEPIKTSQSIQTLLEGSGVVLVIDDDGTVRELLKNYLTDLGYAVASAADGREGLRLAEKLRPDAIILDIRMPHVDGWKILSELKSDSLLADIPVIMMSVEEQQKEGFALDATDYLVKPVQHKQLVAVLEKYHIGDDSQQLIMIVEDDNIIREFMSDMLKNVGLRIFKAENGKVALEHLNKKPSLILLDLKMPVMDGFEFLIHLRENELWQKIPVVVLTSTHLTSQEQACLQGSNVETIFQKQSYSQDELFLNIHQMITNSKRGETNQDAYEYQIWDS